MDGIKGQKKKKYKRHYHVDAESVENLIQAGYEILISFLRERSEIFRIGIPIVLGLILNMLFHGPEPMNSDIPLGIGILVAVIYWFPVWVCIIIFQRTIPRAVHEYYKKRIVHSPKNTLLRGWGYMAVHHPGIYYFLIEPILLLNASYLGAFFAFGLLNRLQGW